MKKYLPIIAGLLLTAVTLSAQDTIVYWNFQTLPYDTLADGGNSFNTLDLISRDTSWHNSYAYTAGALPNPDKSISSTNWAAGNGLKYYMIGFSTSSYSDIVFDSKQRSSPTGPKYFKVQYRVTGSGVWTDVPGASVTCADNFTSGVLAGISLPVDCNNQPDLYLRWIMNSDSSVQFGLVANPGTSRLDEVYILSTTYVGINETPAAEAYNILPNPCSGSFTIDRNTDEAVNTEIIDITGKLINSNIYSGRSFTVSVAGLESGLYFVRLTSLESNTSVIRKLVVR